MQCASALEPIVDAVFAVADIYPVAACKDAPCPGGAALSLPAVPSLFSAIYGAVQLAGCHEAKHVQQSSIAARREKMAEQEAMRRREESEVTRRAGILDEAWSDARRVEDLARSGNCAGALALARTVHDADVDLYENVLVRDAAFARCLRP